MTLLVGVLDVLDVAVVLDVDVGVLGCLEEEEVEKPLAGVDGAGGW